MDSHQIDIADMQCWLLRMAQNKWAMPAKQVASVFRENGVLDYIADNYELLHLSSYRCALSDIEGYLKNRGVMPC